MILCNETQTDFLKERGELLRPGCLSVNRITVKIKLLFPMIAPPLIDVDAVDPLDGIADFLLGFVDLVGADG